jgi:hypothetical protein
MIARPNGDGFVTVRGARDIIRMIELVLEPAGRGGHPVDGANAAVAVRHMSPYQGITEITQYGSS